MREVDIIPQDSFRPDMVCRLPFNLWCYTEMPEGNTTVCRKVWYLRYPSIHLNPQKKTLVAIYGHARFSDTTQMLFSKGSLSGQSLVHMSGCATRI
jgi:hypothetical protein